MNLTHYIATHPLSAYDIHFIDEATNTFINVSQYDLDKYIFVKEESIYFNSYNNRHQVSVVVKHI